MKKFKNIIKIVVIIILVIILVLIGVAIYKKAMLNKFINLLSQNDSSNYELIQSDGTTTTTVKVKDEVLVSEDDDTIIWISEADNTRIIMDKNSKVAMITENSEEAFVVEALNSTYINDYFENSDWKFKYLRQEDNLYKVQFTHKNTGAIAVFYINSDTGIVEQLDENFGGAEVNFTFEVSFDVVTDEDVAYPDLTAYAVRNLFKHGVNYL